MPDATMLRVVQALMPRVNDGSPCCMCRVSGLGTVVREKSAVMQATSPSMWLLAGVVVTLAYFVLVGYLARALRTTQRLPVVIASMAGLVGALPAVLYALYYAVNVVA